MIRETGFNPMVESYQTQKLVFDSALLNTQHYKVRIKGKVEQSREWVVLYFDLLTRPKMPFQGDAPEGGDTF